MNHALPMSPPRRWMALCAAMLLSACASNAPVVGTVDAPHYLLGDHWQYRIVDNLRMGAVSQLDIDVVAVTPASATLHLVYVDSYGARSERSDEVDAAGGLIAGVLKPDQFEHFNPPAQLYRFPLSQRQVWRQTINTIRRDLDNIPGQILIYGTVQGTNSATVPAGTFDGIALYRILQLDDDQYWRTRTTRRDQVLYSPMVRGVVREIRDASYHEIDGPDSAEVRTENTTRELLSFTPGK
jgi:hypothetical protein